MLCVHLLINEVKNVATPWWIKFDVHLNSMETYNFKVCFCVLVFVFFFFSINLYSEDNYQNECLTLMLSEILNFSDHKYPNGFSTENEPDSPENLIFSLILNLYHLYQTKSIWKRFIYLYSILELALLCSLLACAKYTLSAT